MLAQTRPMYPRMMRESGLQWRDLFVALVGSKTRQHFHRSRLRCRHLQISALPLPFPLLVGPRKLPAGQVGWVDWLASAFCRKENWRLCQRPSSEGACIAGEADPTVARRNSHMDYPISRTGGQTQSDSRAEPELNRRLFE